MLFYFAAVSLHILAVLTWIGLMSYWALVLPTSSAAKSAPLDPRLSVTGWVCCVIALVTGGFLLYAQGVSAQDVSSGWLFHGRFGQVLHVKVLLIAVLLLLQFLLRRHHALVRWPFLIIGLATVGISTFLIR